MILVDSSAWLEFLRGTDSPVCREVDRWLAKSIAITDPIQMEVLAGARDDRHLGDLRGLLARASIIRCEPADFLTSAELYRRCRRSGATVRRMIDCLIAAVAIRSDVRVLHNDADFDVLARHSELQIQSPSVR